MDVDDYVDKINDKNLLVIVEGKKDRIALEGLGIKRILEINPSAWYKVIDLIDEKEVVILTDLDKEGKRLYSVLKDRLQRKGVKVNDKFRNFLFKTRLRQIEGINSYIKNENRKRNRY